MSENMEAEAGRTYGAGVSPKKNQAIFYVLNLLLIVPVVVRHRSLWGTIGAAVILFLAFHLYESKSGDGVCAVRNLPLLGVSDICVLLALYYQPLYGQFTTYLVSPILSSLADKPLCIFLLVGGAVLSLLPFKDSAAVWGNGLGKTIIGAAFLLLRWSDGALQELSFWRNGDVFLGFYLICALLWYTMCAAAYHADNTSLRRSKWLSWLLLALFIVLCLTETALVQAFVDGLWNRFLAMHTAGLAWWKAVLAIVVLAGCSVAAYEDDFDRMGADALVLGAMAGGVLLLRVLMSHYFAFSWVVFLVFLAGSLRCLQNEQKYFKTLRLTSLGYMTVQTAALLLAVLLFKRGLWVLVCLLGIYGLIFYAAAGKWGSRKRSLVYWLIALSCPAVLAEGYIWRMCFLPEACVMVAAVYVFFAAVMAVLHWPHPAGRGSPNGYKWLVCVLMTVLCLLSVFRYGTKVQVEFQTESSAVSIELEARGSENKIGSATYQWSGAGGETHEGHLSAGKTVIPIEGEKLTIVAADRFGATTTVTDWYPRWLLR